MRRLLWSVCIALLSVCFLAGSGLAQEEATDITEDVLTGPGEVSITTKKDIMMSFGAQARFIPTSESNYDFGIEDNLEGPLLGGQVNNDFFQQHANEAGFVKNEYIRTEARLYFNALPKNRKWSFYAALEYDRPLETASVDSRGGKDNNSSNFGLERLHATYALPFDMRFHAGWDAWGVDIIDGGGLVYGDDNPGFWLSGDYDMFSFNLGYFKLNENEFQINNVDFEEGSNNDRSVFAGTLTFKPVDKNKIQAFYVYDKIRNEQINDFTFALTQNATLGGIASPEDPTVDSHYVGAYYTGTIGMFELFAEGVYKFGSADETGLDAINPNYKDDYDISAYAFAGDLAIELKDYIGFSFKPHIGAMYTSGDDDPNDDELNGYTGVVNSQRFSNYWGGENTIIGDTNYVLGTNLYGYLPEMYGNGPAVSTGGLNSFAGFGNGRGDNPGMTMYSVGVNIIPKKYLILRSNVNSFYWNEDFQVYNLVALGQPPTKVDSGYVGTEWDNELTLALSKNTFVKGQFSFFFPGEGIEDVTKALGAESDDTASRIAAELIWKF